MNNHAKIKCFLERGVFVILSVIGVLIPLLYSTATTQVWGLIKITATEVLVVLAAGFWALRLNEEPRVKIVLSPLGWGVVIFFVWSAVSLFFCTNHWEGIQDICQLGSYVLLFFLAEANIRDKKKRFIALAVVVTAFTACLYSIYRDQGPYIFTALRQSYISTFGHPVFFAGYLISVIPVGIALFLSQEKRLPKLLLGLILVTLLFFLVLTKTRGAWVGLFFSFIIMTGLFMRWRQRNKDKTVYLFSRKNMFILTGSLMALIIGMSVFSSARVWQKEVVERIYSTFSPGYVTNAMRLKVWGNTLRMVKEHFFFGVGIGNFRVVYPSYRSVEELSLTPEGQKYSNTHNDLLQILAETGPPGLLAFIWIILAALLMCRRFLERTSEFTEAAFMIGIVGSLSATLIQSFFGANLRIPSSAMMFWLWLGILSGMCREPEPALPVVQPCPINKARYFSVITLVLLSVPAAVFLLSVPLVSDIYFNKGLWYGKQNRNVEAAALYEKSASLASGNYEPYFMLGNAYQNMEMFPEAFMAYEKAVKLNPYHALAVNNLGGIYYRNNQFDKAIEQFESAIRINPLYFGARYNLFLAYTKTANSPAADEQMRFIMEFKPEFIGDVLMRQKNYAQAVSAYRKAAAIKPDSEDIHMNLGIASQAASLNAQAEAEFKKVIAINPSNLGAYRRLGFILSGDTEKTKEAVEVYRKIVGFLPGDIEAHYNLGGLCARSGDLDSARREFENILSLNPEYFPAYIALGEVFAKMDNFDEALRCFKEALRIDPNSRDAKELINNVYLRKMNGA